MSERLGRYLGAGLLFFTSMGLAACRGGDQELLPDLLYGQPGYDNLPTAPEGLPCAGGRLEPNYALSTATWGIYHTSTSPEAQVQVFPTIDASVRGHDIHVEGGVSDASNHLHPMEAASFTDGLWHDVYTLSAATFTNAVHTNASGNTRGGVNVIGAHASQVEGVEMCVNPLTGDVYSRAEQE